MKYISENVNAELSSLFAAIYRDPASWEGWRCLRVESLHPIKAFHEKNFQETTRDILDRFFADRNGIVYFTKPMGLYVFCKDMPDFLAKEAAFHLTKQIEDMTGGDVHAHWSPVTGDNDFSAEAVVSAAGSPVRRVLLVEDDPVTRWIVRTALKDECILLTAPTAGVAIESYHKCRPDLVLLDINLPDKNGQEVLAEIFHGDPKANIVMFSSHDNVDTMVKMIEEGASGFIAKPFTRQRLLNYVRKCG